MTIFTVAFQALDATPHRLGNKLAVHRRMSYHAMIPSLGSWESSFGNKEKHALHRRISCHPSNTWDSLLSKKEMSMG
jgi:hypothetical protein